MTDRGETVWPIKPHTKAKHAILRRYLQAWFPILHSAFDKLVYIDGFAGPGEYADGEPGSPMVALSTLQNHKTVLQGEFHFLFVEKRPDRFAHLDAIINEQEFPPGYKIRLFNDEFSRVLKGVLENQQFNRTPIFAFVDPFGVAGVPYDQIAQLLGRRGTEAFILFARDAVNRWLEHENVQDHIRELFGLDNVEIPEGVDRLEHLRDLYERRLAEIAKYVGSFTMQNVHDRPIYDLFFASNSVEGFVKMKDAMWSVDAEGGFRFSDASNPDQTVLFKHDPARRLADIIHEGGSMRPDIEVSRIKQFVRKDTRYKVTHMKAALRQLEDEGRIRVHPVKTDGKTRRKGTFPDGTVVDFLGD